MAAWLGDNFVDSARNGSAMVNYKHDFLAGEIVLSRWRSYDQRVARKFKLSIEHRGEYPALWAAVESIAPKIGCVPQTLLEWVKRQEVDGGLRAGITTAEAQRVKELEREVKELRRANEILKLASAFFAQAELDRRLKS